MSFYTDETEATMNIGTEQWVRAYNSTGSTITNGSIVYISGTSSGLPLISNAVASARTTAHSLGVVTHDIENGTQGWVTVRGLVRGLDLSAFSAGDTVYLSSSTPGSLTATKPSGANYPVEVGLILSATGTSDVMYVHLKDPLDSSDVVGTYGEVYVNGNATGTSIPSQNSWVQFTNFNTNGISRGATPDHTNDHITISETGVYKVEVSASFSGSSSQTYEIQAFKNNGTTGFTNIHLERKIGTGGDIGAAQCGGLVDLTATDTVEVWVQCTSTTGTTLTLRDANLNVTRIN
jgi:hypothetical protein